MDRMKSCRKVQSGQLGVENCEHHLQFAAVAAIHSKPTVSRENKPHDKIVRIRRFGQCVPQL